MKCKWRFEYQLKYDALFRFLAAADDIGPDLAEQIVVGSCDRPRMQEERKQEPAIQAEPPIKIVVSGGIGLSGGCSRTIRGRGLRMSGGRRGSARRAKLEADDGRLSLSVESSNPPHHEETRKAAQAPNEGCSASGNTGCGRCQCDTVLVRVSAVSAEVPLHQLQRAAELSTSVRVHGCHCWRFGMPCTTSVVNQYTLVVTWKRAEGQRTVKRNGPLATQALPVS